MLIKKIMIILLTAVFIYAFVKLKPEEKLSNKKIYIENILSKEIKKLFNVDISKWGQNGHGYETAKRKNRNTILYFYKKKDPLSIKFDHLILTDSKFKYETSHFFKVEIDILNSKEELLIANLYNVKTYPAILVGSFKKGFKGIMIYDKNNKLDKDIFYNNFNKMWRK